MQMAEMVGLEDFLNVWPESLSGGMAQRVALARAFIQNTDVLLLDEPFGALDALTREQMGVELLRIWEVMKKTVIMVTHSISEALLLADRVLVLSDRPAQIVLDKNVDLPRPRTDQTRYTRQFQELARELHDAISSN
jgi:NitT/TauT family transport system ATP-binding protein